MKTITVWMKWHYGWTRHRIKARGLGDAAKRIVLREHEFLTKDNHTIRAEPNKTILWGGKKVKFNSVVVYRNENSPPYSGPDWARTDYWFATEYRATKP